MSKGVMRREEKILILVCYVRCWRTRLEYAEYPFEDGGDTKHVY
jgi:hypothetical protein